MHQHLLSMPLWWCSIKWQASQNPVSQDVVHNRSTCTLCIALLYICLLCNIVFKCMFWHVCNKLQKWSQANKWCLRVIALHSRTWTLRELIVSLHWCRARAVKWATNTGIFRVTSTVKGESAWKRVGQHWARTGQGKTSAFLQQEINRRSRSISHWLCIVNAPRPRELTSPPASHNLASGRPSHTVPQPFPRTRFITRKCHRDNKYDHTGKYWHLPSDFQEYQKQRLSQVAGKAGAKKEPFPSPTPTAGQRRRQSGKTIGNTRRTQVVLCSAAYQAVANPFALSKRRISPPPEKGTLYISQKCHQDNK